jgi:hypothetical protein
MLLMFLRTSARSTGGAVVLDFVVVVVVVVVVVPVAFPAGLLFSLCFSFSFALTLTRPFLPALVSRFPIATAPVPAQSRPPGASSPKTQKARPGARPYTVRFFFLTLYIQNIKLQRGM